MDDEILAVVEPSAIRRWMGIGMLAFVALLVLYVALAAPADPFWQVFLLVIGATALWMAERMRRATRARLELTRTELRDTAAGVIVRLDDIAAVDRGTFAFKPSNGFLIRTKEPGPRGWRPGLWWRMGRRIGVGGVAAAHQTKAMAEALSMGVIERAGEP
jgi:hypothetical protein